MNRTSNKNLVVVDISDMRLSKEPGETLVTYSLGSCLGVSIYDPIAQVGGMIHCMLPLSKIDFLKAQNNPAMFVDTGIPALFNAAYQMGARKDRIILKVAGGAQILDDKMMFNIGKRNYTILRKILWKNEVLIASEDVGGSKARTMYLDIGTGWVGIKSAGKITNL